MKKLISIVFALTLICAASLQSMAVSTHPNIHSQYDEYLSLIEKGIIGTDVDFQTWVNFIEESKQLEKQLSASVQFELVYDSKNEEMAAVNSAYTMQAGDVFVTNGTSSSLILGHAAMAIDVQGTKIILHIAGTGHVPEVIGLISWHNRYTNAEPDSWTKIYRHTNSSTASAAATWEKNTYLNSNVPYKITSNLHTTNETYCSKMVWQAYYYGPSTPSAEPHSGATIIPPYSIPTEVIGINRVTTVSSSS